MTTHQIGTVAEATSTLSKSLKKSVIKCSKDVKWFTRSIGELVDVEDLGKTIHYVTHPEQQNSRKTSIVHTPIDWSKYPPSAFRQFSEEHSVPLRENNDDDDDDIDDDDDDNQSFHDGNKKQRWQRSIEMKKSLNSCTDDKQRSDEPMSSNDRRMKVSAVYIHEHTKSLDHNITSHRQRTVWTKSLDRR